MKQIDKLSTARAGLQPVRGKVADYKSAPKWNKPVILLSLLKMTTAYAPKVLRGRPCMLTYKRSLLPAAALILSLLFMTTTPAQAASVNTFADLQLACSTSRVRIR